MPYTTCTPACSSRFAHWMFGARRSALSAPPCRPPACRAPRPRSAPGPAASRAGAVHGLLDREHIRVGDGLLHERIHRCRERVVWVVNQDVTASHRRQHICLLALLALKPTAADAGEGRVAKARETRQSGDVEEVRDVHQALHLVHLALVDLQGADELLAHDGSNPGSTSSRTTSPKRLRRSSSSTAWSRSSASSEMS